MDLLDPAQDPPRARYGHLAAPYVLPWQDRTDAARAALQEAVEVLELLHAWDGLEGLRHHERALSPDLALLIASAWQERVKARGQREGEGLTTEDYLEAMKADGLRVRGGGDG